MSITPSLAIGSFTITLAGMLLASPAQTAVRGWTDWRGPLQTGVSLEKGLPDTWTLGGSNDLWHYDIAGGGTPVIANGKVYAFSYDGQGPDLQEVLLCVDAETGKKVWEKRFNDFLSDIVYDRYAIGSPAVDAETGNVYIMTSAGLFSCFTGDGKPVWQHSLMEEIGRLTFTNGRTGSPLILDDLVIIRGITGNWGAEGAAGDRLYAYDKKSGKLVWSSGPGGGPKDNSFARPWIGWLNGKQVLYTGNGDGSVVCVNARTGAPIWRYPVSAGGLNASVVLYKNTLVAIHADENLESSDIGRMVAIKVDAETKPAPVAPAGAPALPTTPLLDKAAEAWHNELAAISSSPVLVGNRLYQVNKTGQLCCVDADTGNILWRHKLAPDQLHASPLYADGRLYIPFQNGMFYIIKPSDSGAQELSKVQLEGRCIGAPSAWNGKVYVHTTKRLYCFGRKGNNPGLPAESAAGQKPAPGKTVALQILPSEVLLRPGEKATFTVRGIDANGFVTETFDSTKATWAKYIPPTARVRAEMNGDFNDKGELVAAASTKPSAGAFEATIGEYKGYVRGRVISALPFNQDFESFEPTETLPADPSAKFAYPPLPWIGARFKFDIRDLNGNKVLAKTLDNVFFQRATVFFGHPDEKNYTYEADVMSDGNRRTMSTVGIINQHYMITLDGNSQELKVSSNDERIRQTVPFKWTAKEWYHLKTRVDMATDGSGVVRAKAWKKSDPEPAAWTIEVPHKHAHTSGSPGLFGFAPQSLFRVYVDNISITPNK
jgi:outer membrane protein assembly factor BamB